MAVKVNLPLDYPFEHSELVPPSPNYGWAQDIEF